MHSHLAMKRRGEEGRGREGAVEGRGEMRKEGGEEGKGRERRE